MARDGKRNPDSMHQKVMEILFGKKDSASIPTDWHSWPNPQRAIYSRLFQHGYILVPGAEYKAVRKAIGQAADVADVVYSWYPNSKD